ncbi:MAG: nuclear transport factor 2 family protein [Sphingomonas sp.]|uniref:nuclear transport factor 2 family protein n=1 Tax=Sphingomonas sp. TaxID=28214 RepID=UPI003F7FC331
MKWIAIAALFTIIAVPIAAQTSAAPRPMPAYPGVPTDLARAAAAFDLAQVKGDGAALESLLADDYLLVNSQDKREDKAQFIADYTAKGFSMEPFAIDDQVIKVWSDGAVLGGAVTMKGMSEGKPYSVRIRFSDIWAKRGGKWQVIYTHANRVVAN